MISTVSFGNLNHIDLKENAPLTIKGKNYGSGSSGGGSSTPLGMIKQKSVLTNANTPRGAFRDLTNASVTPHQLSSKNKKLITSIQKPTTSLSSTPTNTNILFVPTTQNSQLKKKKLTASNIKLIEKKKLVSPITQIVVKEKKSVESTENEVPKIDIMYPAPKIPLSLDTKFTNTMIQSIVMTPASNDIYSHSSAVDDNCGIYDNYDDIDFATYDVVVPEPGIDDLLEPPASPILNQLESDFNSLQQQQQPQPNTFYNQNNNNNNSNNNFSFTDYFNQIIL